MVLQPEIGILGFLWSVHEGRKQLLVQAKTEPGNVGVAQFAPTFQCTVSNYNCIHGGQPAPYREWFLEHTGNGILGDTLQTEQGGRFAGKLNRNVMMEVPPEAVASLDKAWRWVDVETFLPLLLEDNTVNTDARSVLACSDWSRLCTSGRPFSRWAGSGGFEEAVGVSWLASDKEAEHSLQSVRAWIDGVRKASAMELDRIPLDSLHDWQLSDKSLESVNGAPFSVRQVRVQALDREVPRWDQPLVDSTTKGLVALFCQRRQGVLHMLAQVLAEVGSHGAVQLTTALQISPGTRNEDLSELDAELRHLALGGNGSTVHLRACHSEEGGRFFQDLNDYLITELPPGQKLLGGGDFRWLTLSQWKILVDEDAQVASEARSVLSILLSLV